MVVNVQVRSTDEPGHCTSRECRDPSVQIVIVSTDCGYTHVPGGVFCLSHNKTLFLSLLAKVEQIFQV